MSDPEIGAELTLEQLREKKGQIVVIQAPGHGVYLTFWLMLIDESMAMFYSAVLKRGVVNFIRDGKLFDDQDREVHVFEYLGEE